MNAAHPRAQLATALPTTAVSALSSRALQSLDSAVVVPERSGPIVIAYGSPASEHALREAARRLAPRPEIDRAELETALSEFGAQGWEFATALLDVALHRENDGHLLLFKRRVD